MIVPKILPYSLLALLEPTRQADLSVNRYFGHHRNIKFSPPSKNCKRNHLAAEGRANPNIFPCKDCFKKQTQFDVRQTATTKFVLKTMDSPAYSYLMVTPHCIPRLRWETLSVQIANITGRSVVLTKYLGCHLLECL